MSSSIDIFASKERPKKLIFRNEKGEEFFFLCKQEKKGDLRKDLRVMEYISIVNRVLSQDEEGKEKHLQLNTFVSVWLSCDRVMLAQLSHSLSSFHFTYSPHSLTSLSPQLITYTHSHSLHNSHHSPLSVRHVSLREDRPHRVGAQLRARPAQAQHTSLPPRSALLQQNRHGAEARLRPPPELSQQRAEGPGSADVLRLHHDRLRAVTARVASAGLPVLGRLVESAGTVHANHCRLVHDGVHILVVEFLGPLHRTLSVWAIVTTTTF